MIKKAVYSNWTKPNHKVFAGFNSNEAYANSLHLSVLYSKKWFEEVELVTDKAGKELVDKYKIPFDNVVVCLDDYNHIRSEHWSLGKMIACSMQKSPFMHIDNDVFWFKRPQERLLRADCSFQNYEHADYFCYKDQRPSAIETCPIKEIDYTETKALNCGIIGFNKLDVIPEWIELALRYIEWFDNNNKLRDWCKLAPIMFEQYHIYQLLRKYNYDISVISYDYATSEMDTRKKMVSDSLAKEYGYTHLISGIKRMKWVEEKVKARLIREKALYEQRRCPSYINSATAPQSVTTDSTVSVEVSYQVPVARDIIVIFQTNTAPWTIFGYKRIQVNAGSSTINIPIDIEFGTPIADGRYKFMVYITPTSGGFPERLEEKIPQHSVSCIQANTNSLN